MIPTPPFPITPRLDAKPWGGRKLGSFGFHLPPDQPIGEALITADEALVHDGPMMGRTLGDIIALDPLVALGERGLDLTHGRPTFPLLIKLIDANEDLSVQVHPDDTYAERHEGTLGKTEAWHVLTSEPEGHLYLGLHDEVGLEDLTRLAEAGKPTGHLLTRRAAMPGETFLLPAGTVHALGAGVVIYEVQQPSAITYRLDDWGRVGLDGQPRALHIPQALAVTREDYRPIPIPPVSLGHGPEQSILAACQYFALERIAFRAGESVVVQSDAPQAITCIAGEVTVATAAGSVALAAGGTAALLASAGPTNVTATTNAIALRAWVPDLARDVAGPALARGVPADDVEALAGQLPDLREVRAMMRE